MRIKSIFASLFTLLPFNWLRVIFLNCIPGYKINLKSKIGFFNIVDFKVLVIKDSTIKHFNRMSNNSELIMNNSSIGNFNIIKFSEHLILNESRMYNRNSLIGTTDPAITNTERNSFVLNELSLITHRHYFDLSYGISIGKNVVFGGEQTQCWTHGYDYKRELKGNSVVLGDDIYVGSRTMILPGVQITDKVTIAAGTVVHRNINESGVYVSNELKLKKKYE